MKQIPLGKSGKFALVDDADFDWLSQLKWRDSCNGYASSGVKSIKMHRLIMQTPKGMHTDHIDGNGLNNQRSNLRICTQSQNGMNRGAQINSTSGNKGVFKRGKRWKSQIKVGKKIKYLGYFASKTEAAIAYNKAALEHFGEFARLNEVA